MERLCFEMTLRAGFEAEYERRHDEIWPEIVDSLRECGYRNYSLFRRGLRVIGYVECVPDVATALAASSLDPVNQRWADSLAGVIDDATDESGTLRAFQEVWHLGR